MFRAIGTLALLVLLGQVAHCQNPPGSQVLGPFGGLHDSDSSITIGDNEAQAANDVRLTKDGRGLKSRQGISINASLTYATSPVVGSHYFKTAGGNLVRLVMHDVLVSRSVNNAAFSNIVTTAPTGIQFYDCADNQGVAYCLSSSNTELFADNGSGVTWYPTLPKGTQVEMTPDRMVISGTAANPNRIHYSQSGALTTFTAGNDAGSAYTDDIGVSGDKIQAIKYALGRIIFWTNNSMGACQGTGQFDSVCYDISKTIGTIEPASVVYYNGFVYFRGTDNHFYAYDGQTLGKLTQAQSVLIGTLLSSSYRSNTQTSQSDFNLGVSQPYNSWDTTSTANSIQPSTWAATDDSSSQFGSGTSVNFSTTLVSGQNAFQYLYDNFNDDDMYASSPAWESCGTGTGTCAVFSSSMTCVGAFFPANSYYLGIAKTTSTAGYGNWSFRVSETTINSTTRNKSVVQFIADGTASCSSKRGYGLQFQHHASSLTIVLGHGTVGGGLSDSPNAATWSVIGSSGLASLSSGQTAWYSIHRTEAGAFNVYRDSVSIITGNHTGQGESSHFVVGGAYQGRITVDDIITPSTASFQSQEFNTAMNPPTWGNVAVSTSISGSSTLTWGTRVAATSGGTKDPFVAVTPAGAIAQIKSSTKPFITYIASATASAADAPVVISSVTLSAATTGQFMSQCLTGNSVSAFGVLSCAITTAGGGTATLYGRSGASCPLSSAWSATTNNAVFAPSANNAFQWRVDSGLSHSTDVVRVDACSLNWTEAQVGATFGGVFDDDIYWSVVASSGLRQNKVLHYDVAHGALFPWNLRTSVMMPTESILYMGCSDCGKLYQFGGVDTDTGTAISASWTSKDLPLGDPTVEKSIDRMSLIMKNQISGNLSLDYTVNGSSTITKTVSMVGTSGNPMVLRNFNTGLGTKGNVFRVRPYGNAPWEIYGIKIDFSNLPWRIQ